MLTFTRDLNAMTLVCSNELYDFYVHKAASYWYTEALLKGTDQSAVMAGFRTLRMAKAAAVAWQGWMI